MTIPVEELPWFRLYTEFSTDPIVQMLAFEDQRHFVMAMCMKRKGVLDREYPTTSLRSRVISSILGLDPVACAEANRRLREVGLVDEEWQPVKWEKRQFRSDSSTGRVRAFRERQGRNGDETFRERSGNAPDADADAEADSDSEHGTSSNPDGSVGALKNSRAKPKGEKKPKATKATACPEPFLLTPSMTAWAKDSTPGVEPKAETAKFVDHWRANRKTKNDWVAAWRNWMRKAQEIVNARPGGVGRGPVAPTPVPADPEWVRLDEEASRAGFRNPYPNETKDDFRGALTRYRETVAKGVATKAAGTEPRSLAGVGDALKGMSR